MRIFIFVLAALSAAAQTPRIANLSTRAQIAAGSTIIAGFNVGPGENKTILVRAAGPALSAFAVAGTLGDPKIELFSGSTKIGENDDWSSPLGGATPITTATFSSVGAFAFPAGSRDAALVATLAPGSYTAVISGGGNSSGVVLIEVYEMATSSARLTNISARAQVGTGANILIPGIVVSPGSGTRRLLVRAAGPSLGALGVANALANPLLTVLDASGAIVASNDNWETQVGAAVTNPTTLSTAFGEAGAFAFAAGSRDAALITAFSPGNYTIQVSGVGNTSGVALVEVYDITPPPIVRPPDVGASELRLEAVYGTYRRLPIQNGYHVGTIAPKPGFDPRSMLQWKNDANVAWNLIPDLGQRLLRTDSTDPYANTGIPNFRLEMQGDEVIGFRFNDDYFARDGATPRINQIGGGLNGYLQASIARPPAAYAYGYSFYTTIWPLIDKHIAGFQIGLAGSWIIPDNEDFTQPLLPLGAGTIREASPERASTYWRDVFQTIEGSSGYWTNLRFPGATPKLRMNGTPNGYNVEISSPGWAWGKPLALSRDQMGIAQLSNRLLIPPDGITYQQGVNGEITGVAWMALPLTSPKTGGLAPIGDQSWTMFLNTANFRGPVAFWIPDIWTRLSRTYTIIQGRGLDARPSLMGGGAMEFNTVPFFQNAAANGRKYTRIPRLNFPVDEQGITYIIQDITAYSTAALFDSVKAWVSGGAAPTGQFESRGAFKPILRANLLRFSQGASEPTEVPISGLESLMQPAIIPTPGSSAFGLRWFGSGALGRFPEFFEQAGDSMRSIPANEVPAETKLTGLTFTAATSGPAYTSPSSEADSWSSPAPRAGPFTVTLVDGTTVTYSWYRFADQPALQALGWTEAEKAQLQTVVERIHSTWRTTAEFMSPPSRGTLVTLDSAVLVTPPAGLEIGYVPIVTRQEAR